MVYIQPIRSTLRVYLFAMVASAWTAIAWCQPPAIPPKLPDGAEFFEESGTILGVMPNVVQVMTKDKGAWIVRMAPATQLKITGTAEPTFLHGGLFVKFAGEIDDKGVLTSEVKELEIFTPMGKASSGVFASGADEKAKPIGKLVAGAYDIRGRVTSFKDGEIQVVAGKKITGKVASDAKIAVNVRDLSFVQKDDAVKAKGYTSKQYAPDIQNNRPGTAIGTEVEIQIANPLTTAPRKGPIKPTKPSKVKPGDAPAAGAGDVFGFDKEKK